MFLIEPSLCGKTLLVGNKTRMIENNNSPEKNCVHPIRKKHTKSKSLFTDKHLNQTLHNNDSFNMCLKKDPQEFNQVESLFAKISFKELSKKKKKNFVVYPKCIQA